MTEVIWPFILFLGVLVPFERAWFLFAMLVLYWLIEKGVL